MKILHHVRREYVDSDLSPETMLDNPIKQFSIWYEESQKVDKEEPNAMSLATYDEVAKKVSCRVVLLKEISPEGLIFFSNFKSRKAMELERHPQAAATIYWPGLHRQVRCEGRVKKISAADSDLYFSTRPKESQVAATISPQSQVVPNRQWLEDKYQTLMQQNGSVLTRPDSWGGYVLVADYWEFWQGRSHRLHDRVEYQIINGQWIKQRLAP